jgi:hypothetical protein
MFYFKLHPLQWQYDGDGEQVFRALELSDGSYLVSWKSGRYYLEVPYTQEEVTLEMAMGNWIIIEENGEE